MSTARTRLNDVPTNILEAIVEATVGSLLIGRSTSVRLRGSKVELDALARAVNSCTRFQEELARPGVTVESAMRLLDEKREAIREFERVVHVRWPL